MSQQHDPQSEGGAQRDAQPGIGLESAVAGQQQHHQRGQRPGGQRPQQNDAHLPGTGDDEADADPRQSRMGHGVTEQALLAQHGETAEHAADQPSSAAPMATFWMV